jgi:hypothetical protein
VLLGRLRIEEEVELGDHRRRGDRVHRRVRSGGLYAGKFPPPDGAGVKETFGLNGEATYPCEGKAVNFRFPALTIALERA